MLEREPSRCAVHGRRQVGEARRRAASALARAARLRRDGARARWRSSSPSWPPTSSSTAAGASCSSGRWPSGGPRARDRWRSTAGRDGERRAHACATATRPPGPPGTGLGPCSAIADRVRHLLRPGRRHGGARPALAAPARRRAARPRVAGVSVADGRRGGLRRRLGWSTQARTDASCWSSTGWATGPTPRAAAREAVRRLPGARRAPAAEHRASARTRRCARTRGAAVGRRAMVRPAAGEVRFAGVGNIAGVPARRRHGAQHGLAQRHRGARVPQDPGVRLSVVRASALLVMHSDGLQTRWDARPLSGPGRARSRRCVAAVLYRDFTRGRDDVTVVVCAPGGERRMSHAAS